MTMLVSNQSQARLAKLAHSFSSQVNARLNRVKAEAAARLKREVDEEARRVQQEKAERIRYERVITERIAIARKGIENLFAVGQSKPIQDIIEALGRLKKERYITFYSNSRDDGDAWFFSSRGEWEKAASLGNSCQVQFHLYQEELFVDCSFHSPGAPESGSCYGLIYNPDSKSEAVRKADGQESFYSVDEFFHEIATDEVVNMQLVGCPVQYSYEWEPNSVAFQLLVNCAKKSSLNYYLEQCLKGLQRKIQI